MSPAFFSLLDNAVSEVLRREPTYFSRFELAAPDIEQQAQTYRTYPLFEKFSTAQIAECLRASTTYFVAKGLRFSKDLRDPDPVAAMLSDSAMDAFAVEKDRLSITPDPPDDSLFMPAFAALHEERRTPDGIRYFVGRRGDRPLLLVTAVGIPLAAWSKLLTDASHGLRVIVVECRYSDLFSGGLHGDTDLRTDAADIAAILEAEAVAPVDVLAWSNGARVAIELASSRRDLVRSLILLGPTLSGVEDMDPDPSEFEQQITKIFAAVGSNPAAGNFFSKALAESIRVRNWDSCKGDPARRASMLLSLPAREHAPMLIAPLANGDLLFNFMRRFAADLRYRIGDRLSSIEMPVLVVTGDHDTIVSNSFTHAALSRFVPQFIRVNITGAGHCIQDLQYRYFRWLVCCFVGDNRLRLTLPTARVDVIPGASMPSHEA